MASITFFPNWVDSESDGNSQGTVQRRKRKGRNDVEKTGEPMFPRLHVNDKMKGGPRAPPRNKMALYEQLTIPSQRFNPRGLPPNTLPMSSIQERQVAMDSLLRLSSTDDHPDEKAHSRDEKQGDEDDCSVPIYVRSRERRDLTRGEKTTSACSKSSSNVAQDEHDDGRRHNYSLGMNSKEDVTSASKEKSKVTGEETIHDLKLPAGQNKEGNVNLPVKKVTALQDQELENYTGYSIMQHEKVGIPPTRSHEEKCGNPKELDDVCVTSNSGQEGEIVKTDVVSEISVADSILRSDISPDDVVGVIGQRQFWKARETIANHQRVFAFQLFELHRLMKVQQLIASSPQLCFEDRFFLANSTDNVSPTAKHPSKCIGKSLPPIMNSEATKKLIDKNQCSADNAMNNTSLPFAKNTQHFGAAHPVPLASERNMTSWCFPQPISHRWLIPVISPSEGLVYKPCPEGYVPYSSMPLMGGFACPTQGNDVYPIKLPTEHQYTHHHSIPHTNRAISDSVGDQSSSCGRGSNCQQSSVPTQKSSFVPSDASRRTELQARSTSHYSERDQSTGSDQATKERDGPHLPVDEVVTHSNMQTHGRNLPIQVIKVVPRNPQSAIESAARIFESIQEERKLQSRLSLKLHGVEVLRAEMVYTRSCKEEHRLSSVTAMVNQTIVEVRLVCIGGTFIGVFSLIESSIILGVITIESSITVQSDRVIYDSAPLLQLSSEELSLDLNRKLLLPIWLE